MNATPQQSAASPTDNSDINNGTNGTGSPAPVVWDRHIATTTVQGPHGRLVFKTADREEAIHLYCRFHGLADDEAACLTTNRDEH